MSILDPDEFVGRMRRFLSDPDKCYPLHEPTFDGQERELVADCIDSTFVSSAGKYVDEMERSIEGLTGATRAVVVVNGTAAIEVSLRIAGVGRDDVVIMPSLTFVATANAVRHAGGSPAFVDVAPTNLGMDPIALRRFFDEHCRRENGEWRCDGKRVGAVMAVHIFGNPPGVDELANLCVELDVPFLEDAAEGLASYVGDRHVGRFGLAGTLSFNGNKLVTTGGGGAILTDDEELGDRIKHLTTTAKRPHRWEYFHTEWAYNYRMPNLNAALGVAQLRNLSSLLERKRWVFDRWVQVFDGSDGEVLDTRPGTTSNRWLNAVLLPDSTALEQRNALLDAACDARILCRPIWIPMHQLPDFIGCPRGDMLETERMHRRVINLPSTASLAG